MSSDFGSFTGTGTVGLASPYEYSARLNFDDFDLSALGRLWGIPSFGNPLITRQPLTEILKP